MTHFEREMMDKAADLLRLTAAGDLEKILAITKQVEALIYEEDRYRQRIAALDYDQD